MSPAEQGGPMMASGLKLGVPRMASYSSDKATLLLQSESLYSLDDIDVNGMKSKQQYMIHKA